MKTQNFQTHIQQAKTVIKHPLIKTVKNNGTMTWNQKSAFRCFKQVYAPFYKRKEISVLSAVAIDPLSDHQQIYGFHQEETK